VFDQNDILGSPSDESSILGAGLVVLISAIDEALSDGLDTVKDKISFSLIYLKGVCIIHHCDKVFGFLEVLLLN
jgi:hypothetical protein